MGDAIAIPIGKIVPGDNYRTDFDDTYIASLWEEIDELGLLHPITVRTHGKGWQIVAGECRWRAHVHGKAKTIAAFVRDDLSDVEAAWAMMTENDGRRDLNPVDQGFSYQRLIDQHDASIEEIAKRIGRRPGYVRDRIALLGLADQIIGAVRTGALPYTTGLKLVGLDRNRQRIALREYLAHPSMTAEAWQARIDHLRQEQFRDAQAGAFDGDFVMTTETYEPVLTSERKPGPVGLARLLERVLAVRDSGGQWSEGLDAEVRFAVEAVVGEKANMRRAAAHKAWGTMRTEKAG